MNLPSLYVKQGEKSWKIVKCIWYVFPKNGKQWIKSHAAW